MRPPARTNFWLGVASSLALVVLVLSSPIRPPQGREGGDCPDILYRNFALVSNDSKMALTTATLECAAVDADYSDVEEKEDDELFWSFSELIRPASRLLVTPTCLLSSPCPGSSPPRTAAVPLRC